MKKVQILVITLVTILLIGCVTFAILYFATDIFKSNKDLFFKYAGQIDLKDFINLEEYSNYLKRTETQGHGNEGEFSIDILQEGKKVNETVKYLGYIDPSNNKSTYDISINKDDETLLSMNYLRDQDLYGILFENVVNQYVVFENNNLKEFATKLGVTDTSNIPDKIENTKLSDYTNIEELKNIFTKYLNVAINTIPKDNFYKLKKADVSLKDKTVSADGYAIDLKVADIQNILIQIFNEAKNDEQIFNIINKGNSDITFEDYQSYIDENIEQLSQSISEEENINLLKISVYKQGKSTIKLSISLVEDEADNIELSIEKSSNGMMLRFNENDELTFEIAKTASTQEQENFEIVLSVKSYDEETSNLNINFSRVGDFESNNVSFNASMNITAQDETNLNVEYKNTANYSAVLNAGEFIEGNHLIINNLSQEQITNLFTNLRNLLSEKLKDEMFVQFVVMNSRDRLYEAARKAADETRTSREQEEALMEEMQENLQSSENQPYQYSNLITVGPTDVNN